MAATHRLELVKFFAATLIAVSSVTLSGCHNFFICQKSSCTTSSSSSGGGDYLYAANSTSGSAYLDGFDVSAGKFTSLSGFPVALPYVPVAMAITPSNAYLYAATSVGLIYGYSIGSAGALNALSSSAALQTTASGAVSMDVSPDGNFLFVLDSSVGILYQYQITSSTGLLGSAVSFPLSSTGLISQQSVRVSPNENFVVCALGTGGDVVFPYSSSSGITTSGFAPISTGATTSGDFGVTIDKNNYIYVARTTGIAVYSVNVTSSTSLTVTAVTEPSLSTGNGPHAITLSNTSGSDVYVGNLTDGTISEYTSSSGTLSNVSGSPVTGPSAVSALARDNSGTYVVAAGYNGSSGLQIFTIGSSGALTLNSSAGTGTTLSVPTAIALTH